MWPRHHLAQDNGTGDIANISPHIATDPLPIAIAQTHEPSHIVIKIWKTEVFLHNLFFVPLKTTKYKAYYLLTHNASTEKDFGFLGSMLVVIEVDIRLISQQSQHIVT